MMDILDRHNKKGLFIVMDNCRIHHSHFVVDAINKRGYKSLFMPTYSPFLDPIEIENGMVYYLDKKIYY